ncbi:hypothetical protein BGW36DRAFT_303870 [Talaromyces proteolyticus]|uniref:Nephrocystin 3-like N-terminal domain-containing protein n=1 Tax=Talaromyces proteolyticus TaxID=1131652 RepID=A0AAD4KJI6_9EURO|nr:uncharacterized protein BGW36DRAFT_303870 [Talaromyces proteolyticus]KAH8691793.1 hypothetical protein BGW36DRAFT_303870 [Talaromyces proteolyticus]
MDGISDTASLAALVELAATIIDYVRKVVDAPIQRKRLLAALIQARGLLSTLVELTNEVGDEDWSYSIQSLSAPYGPLSTFQELLENMTKKLGITPGGKIITAFNRLRWPLDQTSLENMITSLEKLKSHFLLAMTNDHIRLSKTIRDELHKVERHMTEATMRIQRQTILSLSREQELIVNSLSLGNLYRELDRDKIMEKRASTEWFLRHSTFKQWHDAISGPSTLVLTGSPGSGKSSTCQATHFFLKAWHQSEIDVCVAYFAFEYRQRETLSESLVLSNIIQQIVLQRPYLVEHIVNMRVTGGALSLVESVGLISQIRRDLKQLYLILDGLDECERTSRNVVEALLQIDLPLRIVVAGRGIDVSSWSLRNSVTVNVDDCITLSDRLDCINKMLEENPRIAAYLDYSPENIAKAAKLIVEQSNGSFIIMTSMVKSLAQSETRATFERLLSNTYPSLMEVYELKLDDVMHQPAELAALANKVLRMMLAGPVRVSQLKTTLTPELKDVASAQGLGMDLTDEEIAKVICSSCKGFVSASDLGTPGLRIHLAHQSAMDFLKTHGIAE